MMQWGGPNTYGQQRPQMAQRPSDNRQAFSMPTTQMTAQSMYSASSNIPNSNNVGTFSTQAPSTGSFTAPPSSIPRMPTSDAPMSRSDSSRMHNHEMQNKILGMSNPIPANTPHISPGGPPGGVSNHAPMNTTVTSKSPVNPAQFRSVSNSNLSTSIPGFNVGQTNGPNPHENGHATTRAPVHFSTVAQRQNHAQEHASPMQYNSLSNSQAAGTPPQQPSKQLNQPLQTQSTRPHSTNGPYAMNTSSTSAANTMINGQTAQVGQSSSSNIMKRFAHPPSAKHISQGPPSTHQMSQGPPSTHQMSQGPPSTHQMSQGPPSTHQMSQGPPSTHQMSQGPPSTMHIRQGPPSTHQVSQGPPSTMHIRQGPPSTSTNQVSQGPPSTKQASHGPPSTGANPLSHEQRTAQFGHRPSTNQNQTPSSTNPNQAAHFARPTQPNQTQSASSPFGQQGPTSSQGRPQGPPVTRAGQERSPTAQFGRQGPQNAQGAAHTTQVGQQGAPSTQVGHQGAPPTQFGQQGQPPTQVAHQGAPPTQFGQQGAPPTQFRQQEAPSTQMGQQGAPPTQMGQQGQPPTQFGQQGQPPMRTGQQSGQQGPPIMQTGQQGPPLMQTGQQGPPPTHFGQQGPPLMQTGPQGAPLPTQFGQQGQPPMQTGQQGAPPPTQFGQQGQSMGGSQRQPFTTGAPPISGAPQSTSTPPIMSSVRGGMPQPMPQPRQPQPKINPRAVPRPEFNEPLSSVQFDTTQFEKAAPPLASQFFTATDTGNANPRFFRTSMARMPSNKTVARNCNIPMIAVARPLGQPDIQAGEYPIDAVDFGERGPVRCQRCAAYVNPYSIWTDHGNKWECCFCGNVQDTPPDYVCPVDAYGLRRDKFHRAELCRGSVEFIAPKSYWNRSFIPDPIYVYCIEVTAQSVMSGALHATLCAIKDSLEVLCTIPNARVGLIAYNGALHYFSIHHGRDDAQWCEAPDIEDPFCALSPDAWVPHIKVAKDQILIALDLIAQLFHNTHGVQACPISAVAAAIDGLTPFGGKVITFQSSLPSCGIGKITHRETVRVYGTEKEQGLFRPTSKESAAPYLALTEKASQVQVSIDFIFLSNQHVDAAHACILAQKTNGRIVRYDSFNSSPTAALSAISVSQTKKANGNVGMPKPPKGGNMKQTPNMSNSTETGSDMNVSSDDMETCTMNDLPVGPDQDQIEQIRQELCTYLANERGFEAVFKLRCSHGIRIKRYLGNFTHPTAVPELDVAVIDSDEAIMIELEHDGKDLNEGDSIYLQAAVLYTSCMGDRRVRIHTISITVTEDYASIFKNSDAEVVSLFGARQACDMMVTPPKKNINPFQSIVDMFSQMAVQFLFAYRVHCAANSSPGQLVLPEALKLVPLYANIILKGDAFAPNHKELVLRGATSNTNTPNTRTTSLGTPNTPGTGTKSSQMNNPFSGVYVRADARVCAIHRLRSLPLHRFVRYFYSLLYSLDDMDDGSGRIIESIPAAMKQAILYNAYVRTGTGAFPPRYEDGSASDDMEAIKMPPRLWPSAAQISMNGLYLLETEKCIFVYISEQCPSELLIDLFGEAYTTSDQLEADIQLKQRDTDLSIRVFNILGEIRRRREPYLPIRVIVPNTSNKLEFEQYLVEDAVRGRPSYIDYLCALHSAIQQKLQSST